ncbi:MAG: hypothetical protein ABSF95_20795 [Verrucomicrobiota bacterium]|jgi:hypothetical protein
MKAWSDAIWGGVLAAALAGAVEAATLQLDGEYTSYVGTSNNDARLTARELFTILLDEHVFFISCRQPEVKMPRGYSLDPGMDAGSCLVQHWITATSWVTAVSCDGLTTTNLVINRPSYPHELANCGDAASSAALLLVRCKEIFPQPTGTRQITPPWVAYDNPLAVIYAAHYSYSNSVAGQDVVGQFVVSRRLRETWKTSPLLFPGVVGTTLEASAAETIGACPPDTVSGSFSIGPFANVGGLELPLRGEFTRYSRGRGVRIRRDVVSITSWREVGGTVTAVPTVAGTLQVEDRRLIDQDLRIQGAWFRTNRFEGLGTAFQARADFERQVARGKAIKRREVRLKVFRWILVSAVVLVPIGCGAFKRRRLAPGERAGSEAGS